MTPNRNEPLSALTKPPAGVRKPKTCGIASTKIIRMTKNFRSEEHTSELQSLMRISYAVFCLKKKKKRQNNNIKYDITKYQLKQKKSIRQDTKSTYKH